MTRRRLKRKVRKVLVVSIYIVSATIFGLLLRSYLLNLQTKIEQCDKVHGYCSINQSITFKGSDK